MNSLYNSSINHTNSISAYHDAVNANIIAYLEGMMAGHVASYFHSDIRLKKDVATLGNSLQKILNIRGVSFLWKDESISKDKQIGVIAQEVEKEFPEVVSQDSDGMKTVNYSALVAPLIEAVKEQQKQIDTQAEQIKLLQEEINSLKK